MKVTLTEIKGPNQGRTVEFVKPRHYLIGRSPDMDFILPEDDGYVSRRHLMLEIAPPNARVVDLGSKNPPHVNGEKIDAADLRDGDVLELGYTCFRIAIDQKIATWTGHCRGCGASVALMEYEEEPVLCGACPPLPRPSPSPEAAHFACDVCSKDLTARAQSDGRAAELTGDVIYRCEVCLPEGDKDAGRMFGQYRAIRRLGGGGMGEVLLGYHTETARLLAVKHVPDLKKEEIVKRFVERETRFIAELRHPSLVRYIDRGIDDDGSPYLVMQYLPDGSLDALIGPENPTMPVEDAVAATMCALDGLAFMHARQIVHRDIKPANILLDRKRRGQPGYTRLSDFGLAVCYANAGGMRITKQNTSMGTLMFMSPEQVRNAADVREAADTYSMGVTLYYLLTGAYTFDFPSPAEIARKAAAGATGWRGLDPRNPDRRLLARLGYESSLKLIVDDSVQPVPVRKRRPDLPSGLADVVDRAVRKPEAERFASAAEMRNALVAALA